MTQATTTEDDRAPTGGQQHPAGLLQLADELEKGGVGAYNGAGPKLASRKLVAGGGTVMRQSSQ